MTKLYTSQTCAPCQAVKKYLSMKGVEYEEVPTDIFGRDEVTELTGTTIVPLLVTDKGMVQGAHFGKINSIL